MRRFHRVMRASLLKMEEHGTTPVTGTECTPLARIIHERCAFVHDALAARGSRGAAGFDTALRAVLKTSPGLALTLRRAQGHPEQRRGMSEGPRIGPESKPDRADYSGLRE